MAVTVTATLIGTYTSKVTNAAMSSAAGSVDILTVPHLLGTSPDFVYPFLRTVINSGQSTFVSTPVVLSANGSQALVALPSAGAGSQNVLIDVLCEFKQTIIR